MSISQKGEGVCFSSECVDFPEKGQKASAVSKENVSISQKKGHVSTGKASVVIRIYTR